MEVKRKAKTKASAGVRDDYLDLVRTFPLRRIRSAKEHVAALKVLMPLNARGTTVAGLSDGESDYLEALATLVHEYETPFRNAMIATLTPVDRIRGYMDARNMKAKDLAPHVGGKAAASLMLNGKRQVSREQAKALAALFSVDAGKFL